MPNVRSAFPSERATAAGFASPATRRSSLLEVDPDLGRELSSSQFAEARSSLTVTVIDVAPGPWTASAEANVALGHLLLEGVVLREVVVSGARSAEVLAAGDVVGPGTAPDDALLDRSVELTVLSPARVVALDESFLRRAGGWPEIVFAISERMGRRLERLATQHAVVQITRVDLRLEGLFWHLAERHGRVTPEGVHLALKLPHRTLARLVGARRPSVTTALGQLSSRGSVRRRPDGTWLLTGEPPTQLDGTSSAAAAAS